MSSELAMVLQADNAADRIPTIGAEIMVEINGGVIQGVYALTQLPFPLKVRIQDHDLSRVNQKQPETVWVSGKPDDDLEG